jgi:HPr kinase/phosphorylase
MKYLSLTGSRGGPREATVHGVLLDVCGVGVLVTGRAGIGKSECALDLVRRGHVLVADDVVKLSGGDGKDVFGMSPAGLKGYMEIQGLGIIDVRALFGAAAVKAERRLDLVIELLDWSAGGAYDRLGVDDITMEVLGSELPHLIIPVSPGRSVATVIQTAALNQRLKQKGRYPAREFRAAIAARIAGSQGRPAGGGPGARVILTAPGRRKR